MTVTNFNVPLTELIPEDHGNEKFPVKNFLLRSQGHKELSIVELRKMYREHMNRFSWFFQFKSVDAPGDYLIAIRDEIYDRQQEKVIDKVDTSDLDKEYVYPGDEE